MRPIYLFICLLILITGCSQRKDFKPAHISGTITFNHFLKSPLESTTRTIAILKNGEVFSQNGQTLLKLKEHARFINETDLYYIIANGNTIHTLNRYIPAYPRMMPNSNFTMTLRH